MLVQLVVALFPKTQLIRLLQVRRVDLGKFNSRGKSGYTKASRLQLRLTPTSTDKVTWKVKWLKRRIIPYNIKRKSPWLLQPRAFLRLGKQAIVVRNFSPGKINTKYYASILNIGWVFWAFRMYRRFSMEIIGLGIDLHGHGAKFCHGF